MDHEHVRINQLLRHPDKRREDPDLEFPRLLSYVLGWRL